MQKYIVIWYHKEDCGTMFFTSLDKAKQYAGTFPSDEYVVYVTQVLESLS